MPFTAISSVLGEDLCAKNPTGNAIKHKSSK